MPGISLKFEIKYETNKMLGDCYGGINDNLLGNLRFDRSKSDRFCGYN